MADGKAATWKVVLAAVLDTLLVFLGGGYVIAKLTGGITESGFQLSGIPALVLFALIFVYFIGAKWVGGTVFRRLLGVV